MEITLPWPPAVFYYLAGINILTFFYFGFDKIQSQREGRRRISERGLWTLSLLGGSPGALLAMKFFRHKTKKISFQLILVVICLIQIIGLVTYFHFFKTPGPVSPFITR